MVEAYKQIEKFKEFIEMYYEKDLYEVARKGLHSITLDFTNLSMFNTDLANELLEEPEETLKAAELSLKHFDIPVEDEHALDIMRVRFTKLPADQEIKIRNIRSVHLGKLMSITGVVRQTSDVRPQVVSATFECPSCGNSIKIPQLEQTFREPSRCSCGRRGRFKLLSQDLIDSQRIVLEESPDSLEGGEQPKRLSIFLREDLVEPKMERKTTPGSKVQVIGVIKEVPIPGKTGATSTRFDLMVEANHIEGIEEAYEDIDISAEDERKIKELARDPKIYEKLVSSIAPSIYGHSEIKGALVLQLMGGVRKERPDGTSVKGDIHILLVGEPGTAKSSMLVYMSKVAPKARYVAGRSTTGAGISATVVKDEFLRGWALEAGALVLANNGILLIDEMDKMTEEDTSALHEAMAQQSFHPQTEIMLADGSVRRIGDFVDQIIENNQSKVKIIDDCQVIGLKNVNILTTDFKKIFPTEVNKVSRHKAPEKFVEVLYSNGRKLVVTPEHPIFVYDKGIQEIPAEKLIPGMLAPAPRILPTETKTKRLIQSVVKSARKILTFPQEIDESTARLLGYIVSEGHSYKDESNGYAEIGVSNTNPIFNKEINQLFSSIFQTLPNTNLRKAEDCEGATLDCTTTRVPSLSLHQYFIDNFYELTKKAPQKRTGNIIRALSPLFRIAFLKTAFKGDGLVDKNRLGYATSSFGLAKDYQDLLLQTGIASYIAITHNQNEGKDYYKVIAHGGGDMRRFSELIIESDDSRWKSVKTLIERSKNRKNDRDIIPHSIISELYPLLKLLGLSNGYLVKNIKMQQNAHRENVSFYVKKLETRLQECEKLLKKEGYSELRKKAHISFGFLAKNLGMSYSNVRYYFKKKDKRVFQLIQSEAERKIGYLKEKILNIREIVFSDLRFISIKSIKIFENKDIEWVYDVTVEPTRAFVSEGLILHNTISISKANIQATLRARTTVLAAANPKFGRFDPYQPIAPQIAMPPPLINRFDLIFPVKDTPDKERDTKIASHILDLQQNVAGAEPVIQFDLLKKYIAYVHQNIYPKLTQGAIEEIRNYYVRLRNTPTIGDAAMKPIPISARQLEALVRLSEASARVRLSNHVTRKDAKGAIDILNSCLMQVGVDLETGQLDIDRITTGITASTRNKITVIRNIIMDFENKGKRAISIEELTAEALDRGLTEVQIEDVINKLKQEGYIYEPKAGFVTKLG